MVHAVSGYLVPAPVNFRHDLLKELCAVRGRKESPFNVVFIENIKNARHGDPGAIRFAFLQVFITGKLVLGAPNTNRHAIERRHAGYGVDVPVVGQIVYAHGRML